MFVQKIGWENTNIRPIGFCSRDLLSCEKASRHIASYHEECSKCGEYKKLRDTIMQKSIDEFQMKMLLAQKAKECVDKEYHGKGVSNGYNRRLSVKYIELKKLVGIK